MEAKMKKIILTTLLCLTGCVSVIPLEEMTKDDELQSAKKIYENIKNNKELTNEINNIKKTINKYNKDNLSESDVKNLLKDLNMKSTNYEEIQVGIRKQENSINKNIEKLMEYQNVEATSDLQNTDEITCNKYLVEAEKYSAFPSTQNEDNAKLNYDQCLNYINNNKINIKNIMSSFEKYLTLLNKLKNYFSNIEKEREDKLLGNKRRCGDISEDIAISVIPFRNVSYDKNCIYDFNKYPLTTVFQALPNGALVAFSMPGWGNTIIKVEDNVGYAEYVDGEHFSGRNYVYTGNYRYTTVLGAMKTIPSFKKLNVEKLNLPKTYFYEGLNYVHVFY